VGRRKCVLQRALFIASTIKFPSSTKEIRSTGTVDGKLISVILYCYENVA